MKYRSLLTALLFCLPFTYTMGQKQISLESPDGRIETIVTIGEELTYAVTHDAQPIIATSAVDHSNLPYIHFADRR